MGLGLPTGGGDGNRTPIIKFDARAGRIFRIDRSNASGQWESDSVEITNGFQAVMDLENIETGWLSFPAGGAPDIRTAKIGTPLPDRPSDKHKAGFRVYMKLGKSSGGDLREMAANASVSIQGMDALYEAYQEGVKANAGKLPVVELEKTVAVTTTGQGQSSTNYRPVWKISRWVDRPAELSGQAAATQTTSTPAEEAKAEAVSAGGEGDEF